MNEKPYTQNHHFQFTLLKSPGHNGGQFRHPACPEERRYLMFSLIRVTRFFQRCWVTTCYMRRLNYSRRLAWAKAAR